MDSFAAKSRTHQNELFWRSVSHEMTILLPHQNICVFLVSKWLPISERPPWLIEKTDNSTTAQ